MALVSGALSGPSSRSALWTDRYKLLMAEAGFPLRQERFVLSFRRGGPYYLPLEMDDWVQSLRPEPPTPQELEWMDRDNGLPMGPGYRAAMETGALKVQALPAGSWFLAHEPIAVVTGPSALVSTLEASLIGETAFVVQVATLGMRAKLGLISQEQLQERLGVATCEQEAHRILAVLDHVQAPRVRVRVDQQGYQQAVVDRCHKVLLVVHQDRARIAEGGLRSATCPQQHRLALQAAQSAGWTATSNIAMARELGMAAVGTTGHEHSQRHGNDQAAFDAATDRIPGDVTLLLDTYGTRLSGIPTAIRVMQRWSGRTLSARPDNEATQESDVRCMVQAMAKVGLRGGISLSGGFDAARTARFEAIRRELDWPAERFGYLYGGSAVRAHVPLPTRSHASAVFKLCESAGRPSMKFSDGPDGRPGPKSSKPGRPVVLRQVGGCGGLIGQYGEAPPAGYALLSESQREPAPWSAQQVAQAGPAQESPGTQALVAACTQQRDAAVQRAVESVGGH